MDSSFVLDNLSKTKCSYDDQFIAQVFLMVFELGFNHLKETIHFPLLPGATGQKNTFTFIRNTKALAGKISPEYFLHNDRHSLLFKKFQKFKNKIYERIHAAYSQ